MANIQHKTTNRVLVVDDDEMLINEYLRCLGEDFEPDSATATLTDLEKVLFGEETDEHGAARFDVHSRNQGEAAVEAIAASVENGNRYAIVFIDIRMPPGIDGIEAAQRIRLLDPHVNIVIVTGSMSSTQENLGKQVPPADKIFFFQKPFHAMECRQLAAALCGKWHADMALRKVNEDLELRVEERTAALQKLAYFDVVTRLPNKLLLIEELKKLIEKAENTDGDTVAVLIDVERFSSINETMGYDAGTELLRSIGNRLSRAFCDEEGQRMAVVGRFGSDEFAVLVPGIKNESEMQQLAEMVKETVELPFLIDGRDLFLTVSVGVSWHPVHGRDAKSVFQCAESALHRSMRTLDKSITYYHSEMRYRARYKFDLEAELRTALEDGQICAHYQPQQCSVSGNIAGVEALARWTRPDGSVVPPSDFVPISEETGLSDSLFEVVLQSVCTDIVNWKALTNWSVPVSVNLSAHQLRNRNLVQVIRQILEYRNIDKSLINLELTESVLLEDLTIAQPLMEDLSRFGVGIHIDDFGTGYSSLSYLATLPAQVLKIDQSFVAQLSDSAANHRVIEAIIALAKAMKLGVVAEGIETDQQYAIVRRLGCDLMQGYFIARPMPADQLLTWIDGYEDTQSIKKRSPIVDFEARRK